jgi:hypothetical protein
VSPWADRYDNGADNLLAIASQTLDGSAPGEWLDTYMTTADARTGDVCGDDSPENWQPIELAGFQGRRYAGTCTDEAGSSFVLEQVVARESDGWVFIWEAPAGSDAEAIQSFEEVLSTFRFPE